jgi:hypothetical protein
VGTISTTTGNNRSIAVRDEIASAHEIFTCVGVLRPDLRLYEGRRLSNLTSDHFVTPPTTLGPAELRTEPNPADARRRSRDLGHAVMPSQLYPRREE